MMTKIPFTELLKSIPGFFGIRIEEQPKYDVVETLDEVEIRRYAPARIARLTVAGEYDEAVDHAFDRLAKYIFGENHDAAKLAMTSPVEQKPEGERMAMTSPVVQEPDGGGWTMTFFLSNDLDSKPPRPNDGSIEIVTEPERLVAALRYRGNNSDEARAESRGSLLSELAEHPRFRVDDSVYWAQYDAPFTLPFVKRNEAMVEVVARHG